MADTSTTICNLALSLLGESGIQLSAADVIASDTDNTSVSRQCVLHYTKTLNELVRMHTWNCAKNRAQLTTSAYSGHNWDYYAAIPTGCLRVMGVQSSTTSTMYRVFIDWVVESGNVLTNYTDPYILYLKDSHCAFVEGDQENLLFGIDYTNCAGLHFLKHQNALELAPYLCLCDYPMYRGIKIGFNRSQNLAIGGTACMFRFYRTYPTERGWPPEEVTEYKDFKFEE